MGMRVSSSQIKISWGQGVWFLLLQALWRTSEMPFLKVDRSLDRQAWRMGNAGVASICCFPQDSVCVCLWQYVSPCVPYVYSCVFGCMCITVYVCICMCVCITVCICVLVCLCIWICDSQCMHMYVCACVSVYVVYVCAWVNTYVYLCACIYICACVYLSICVYISVSVTYVCVRVCVCLCVEHKVFPWTVILLNKKHVKDVCLFML